MPISINIIRFVQRLFKHLYDGDFVVTFELALLCNILAHYSF